MCCFYVFGYILMFFLASYVRIIWETKSMKLLYAEDERTLSEAVIDILSYHKYIVDAVYNGIDAYEYAVSARNKTIMERLQKNKVLPPIGINGECWLWR